MKDNPEVKAGEFRCSHCGKIFTFKRDDGWDNDKAMDEAHQHGIDLTNARIVCDDCYKLTPWGSP